MAKMTFYQNELQMHKGNISKQWRVLNEITVYVVKKKQHNCIPLITDDFNCKVTDKARISDLLNEYFSSIGPNMDFKITKTAKKFSFPSLTKSVVFDSNTAEEVLAQIQQLNSNKAPGPENISVKFLRVLSTITSPYLCNISSTDILNMENTHGHRDEEGLSHAL